MGLPEPLAFLSLVVVLPLVMLFWDYPGERTYIALRYLISFFVAAFLLPVLLQAFGLWLPMASPLLVFS